MTLAFADNATVVLGDNVDFSISSYFTEGGVTRAEIALYMGRVAAQVCRSCATKSDFRIKNPTGTISVRGTTFTVFYDPGSKAELTSVQEGTVTVTPANRKLAVVNVPAGKEIEVTPKSESKLSPIGKANARGGIDRMKALDLVMRVLGSSETRCGFNTARGADKYSVTPSGNGWKVAIKLSGKRSGTASWQVNGGAVTPTNQLARAISAGCGSKKPPPAPGPTPRPTPTATSASSGAPAGHYAGKTSQNDIMAFDVTAGGNNVTNLQAVATVSCTDSSTWTWTVTSSNLTPISGALTFSRAYTGALSSSDTSITNISVDYTLTGKLTVAGTASGNFLLSHISWDSGGKHFDCTGTSASWTAKLGG
jgi:hypothetical protein